MVKIYKNLGRNSGVIGYESGNGFIIVRFRDGSAYLYTNQSTGAANIAHMQALAERGQGLNSFISRYVRKNYAQKLA